MVEANEFKLHERNVRYYEDGLHHGRSILLLHGGIGDAKQNWQDIIPIFSEEYHVLAPDLPGFGGTESIGTGKTLSDIIVWLLAFLESQGVNQVVVIGSSFGALIARLMAAQHPHVVAAIVLINGGFVPDVPAWAKVLMGLPVIGTAFSNFLARMATSESGLKDMIYHPEALTPELIESVQSNVSGFAYLMQMTASQPLPEKNKPMVSVLILWGTEDKSTSLSAGNTLKAALGSVDFVQIEECGHLPHIEEPDIFEWQVKNFLDKQNPVKRSSIPGT